jgi:hypothetical protein
MLALLALLPGPSLLLIIPASVTLLFGGRRLRWLWRFARRVRQFRTASKGQIVLHSAPELDWKWHMPTLLQRCQVELDRLMDQFGAPLRGRVVVYLFARHKDIREIFGPQYGGAALLQANAIIIADDNNIQESMRHEFAHLFSGRWNWFAPPLLSEGLSVWMQETWHGLPVDTAARPLLRNRSLKLPLLLKPRFFFAESYRHSCYVLAGSFSGFLIRRYGWQKYRKLFRMCDGTRFRKKFEKCYGVTLEKAECQWRNEIVVLEILSRRLGKNICS